METGGKGGRKQVVRAQRMDRSVWAVRGDVIVYLRGDVNIPHTKVTKTLRKNVGKLLLLQCVCK